MRKLGLLLLLIGFFSCSDSAVEPDCDERCVEVTGSYRNYDGSRWLNTYVEAKRICDGSRVRWRVGTIDIEVGSIICRDEF